MVCGNVLLCRSGKPADVDEDIPRFILANVYKSITMSVQQILKILFGGISELSTLSMCT